MESKLVKINPQYVQAALAMTHISVDLETAAVIQDVIHALIDKETSFSLEDAVEITEKHKNLEKENKEMLLRERYRTLSELYVPNSKHKLQIQISKELNAIIKQLNNPSTT
jgi:hypothetical protein